MDSRRAQTLEALGTFIAQQKALLARTQTDLETLRRLKSETVADAGTSAVADVGTLADQLSGSAFRLSEQADCAPSVPDIHWDLFARKDPKPLQQLAVTARAAHAQRNKPNPIPRSGPSDLQMLVREARQKILDPVLAAFRDDDEAQHKTPPPGSPQVSVHGHRMPPRGPSGLFTRRAAAAVAPTSVDHADDASTTAVGSGSAPSSTRCRSPPSPAPDQAAEGDVEAETELPMALAKPVRARRISTKLQRQNQERSVAPIATRARRQTLTQGLVQMQEAQAPQPQIPKPKPLTLIIPATRSGPVPAKATDAAPEPKRLLRLRKPKGGAPGPLELAPISKPKPEPEPEPERDSEPPSPFDAEATPDSDQDATPDPEPEPDEDPAPSPPPPTVLGKRQRQREAKSKKLKPKPDTYKVMWSPSEQNLLERLLEEIPVGDPRRYLKISIAMDGRRTPRQVSSRVQKYMQKLRRFGLGG